MPQTRTHTAATPPPSEAAFFFAPFVSSPFVVEPGWIDYNGHLNMAYYHVLFDRTIDEAFGLTGLGSDYVRERGASYFAAEVHVRYLREIGLGDPVRVTLQLLDFDQKRIHFFMELRHAREGWVSATSENLSLHVDFATRKVVPFPPDIAARLAELKASHALLPRPEAVGRVIAMPRRTGAGADGGTPTVHAPAL